MSRGHIAAAAAAITLALAAPAAARADGFSFPLKAWYPLNEGSGQVVHDWSGNGNNGYLGSTPGVDDNDPSWIPGVFAGSALSFAGGDYVTIPSPSSLEQQNLTVAAWVRAGSTPGQFKYVVNMGGAPTCQTGSWGLYTGGDGGLSFYIADTNTHYYISPSAAPSTVWDGKWHNVAGTYDGKTLKMYLDGVQVGAPTAVPAGTQVDYNLATENGELGGHEPSTCNQDLTLTGDIDGVQVWSQALPVDTIWKILKTLFSTSR
jgi:hypothetical protein